MVRQKSHKKRWFIFPLIALILLLGSSMNATPIHSVAIDWPEIEFVSVAGGLSEPVHLTHAGDGSNRLFVVERSGVIKIIRNDAVEPTPFLDISGRVNSSCSECGLLSVAFPSDFANNGTFFVYYNAKGNPVPSPYPGTEADPANGNDSIIARFKLTNNPDQADPASEEQILLINQPQPNHNGGQIAFGKEGQLYIGMGDGGGGGDPLGAGQRKNTLLGKILRISVGATGTYSIPADNPFANEGDTTIKKEIWSYGWRNPWRFSFDRTTGDLYVGDVGQRTREEVDYEPAGTGGLNYGWNVLEGNYCYPDGGTCDTAGKVPPIFDYNRDLGTTVTGGVVYRGSEFARMIGVYFFGDFSTGRLWGAKQENNLWEVTELSNTDYNISSFGEDEAGNAYLVHYGGQIYRLLDKGAQKVYLPIVAR